MAVSSRRFIRARISRAKFRQISKLFALDLTATQIAALTGPNRNTVNSYLTPIRRAVAAHCERESPFAGEVELGESYFGARRVRGARGKTIVFGIYKRDGRVYTEVVPNCKKASLRAIIRGKAELTATIHTDGSRSYDGIVHTGYRKHYRVRHDRDEFVRGNSHINGIEGLWGRRFTKFCVSGDNQPYSLERRFDYATDQTRTTRLVAQRLPEARAALENARNVGRTRLVTAPTFTRRLL